MITNGEIISNLWEDDENHDSYFKKCRKDLYDTLAENGMKDIIIKLWGGLAIDCHKVTCDYYEWLEGNPGGIRAFNGEYMEQYSWAELTKASLYQKI